MSLGSWIQQQRRSKNLSITEIELKSGLSIGSLRAYEQGRRVPTVESMNKLLEALDFHGYFWSSPTTWIEPNTGRVYDFARYPGDNRQAYKKETKMDGPQLGLATTEELFRELMARFTTSLYSPDSTQRALILAEMLGGLDANDREYRTAEPVEQSPDLEMSRFE